MKKLLLLFALTFCLSSVAQEKKQYRSAKSGRYVTKKQAEKSPSTTYGTARKSSGKKKS